LTTHGIGVDGGYGANFQLERKALYNCYRDYYYSKLFISAHPKLMKKDHTYTLKHKVERWLKSLGVKDNYIREGAFILAAFDQGYTIKEVVKDTTSVYLKQEDQ
jgi:hypothetical protein